MQKTIDKHNGLIDFYRFLFSLVIVIHHSYRLSDTGYLPLQGGYAAVEFFFILSGFLLGNSAWKKESINGKDIAADTVNEMKKRVINMWRYYIPVALISFAVQLWKNSLLNFQSLKTVIEELGNLLLEALFLNMTGIGYCMFIPVIWFFSALLISILIIYPLMRRYREIFFAVFAPVITLMCYGYHAVNFGNIGSVYDWNGYVYSGVIRAIAGVCLGTICFYAYLQTKSSDNDRNSDKASLRIIAIVEVLLVISAIFVMNELSKTKADFILIIIFALLIYLAFAYESMLNIIFDRSFFRLLGKLSLSLYLSHCIFYMYDLPYHTVWKYHFALYVISSIVLAVINYTVANLINKTFKKYAKNRRSCL